MFCWHEHFKKLISACFHVPSFLCKYIFIWTQLLQGLLLCNGKQLACYGPQVVLIAGNFELKGHCCYQNSNQLFLEAVSDVVLFPPLLLPEVVSPDYRHCLYVLLKLFFSPFKSHRPTIKRSESWTELAKGKHSMASKGHKFNQGSGI